MKKVKKITTKNLKNIVKENFLEDSFLPEHKIDKIIKEYLLEREELLNSDYLITEKYEFSPKTIDVFSDMLDGLNEMLDDLDIIKEKEGDVLIVEGYYADENITEIIQKLTDVTKSISKLKKKGGQI
jgi:hypothetical protein